MIRALVSPGADVAAGGRPRLRAGAASVTVPPPSRPEGAPSSPAAVEGERGAGGEGGRLGGEEERGADDLRRLADAAKRVAPGEMGAQIVGAGGGDVGGERAALDGVHPEIGRVHV